MNDSEHKRASGHLHEKGYKLRRGGGGPQLIRDRPAVKRDFPHCPNRTYIILNGLGYLEKLTSTAAVSELVTLSPFKVT
jgi:hypothetical protein